MNAKRPASAPKGAPAGRARHSLSYSWHDSCKAYCMSTTSPGTSDTAHPAKPRLDYLDGVRGLAALFVVAHHLWRSYTETALPGLRGVAANWLLYGHLAVDVFIVLSGACLMLPVARSRSLRGGWQTFYKSRARRILPPLYAAIAFGLAVNVAHGIAHKTLPSPKMVLLNLLLLQDLVQSANILDSPLWSVALEWKIYFLFPVFVWLWLRFGSRAVLLVSAVIGYGLTGILSAVYPSLYLPLSCPWFVFLFGMGMAATDFAMRGSRTASAEPPRWLIPSLFWAALACLALLLFRWPVTAAGESVLYVPHLPLIDTAAGTATALALVILSRKAMRQERSLPIALLSWPPLVFVGTIGYSVYLIHILIIYRIRDLLLAHLPVHPALAVIALDMVITVGAAYLFHLVFERPFMSKPGKPAIRTEREAEVAAIESPAP